ncbi:MAG TPA: hypothetical protein PK544_08310 [Spirochaetota bacterium]|nr:hypothetical protein [Spirochaetota bacterium]HPJ39362.1 hypothetical protein [Spirochaetota bacterium]HPQ53810.1 hypothetical protein [Spirochaetota bacterium]
MQREIVFDKINTFITELKAQNISRVAFAQISELRPKQAEKGLLNLVPLKKIEVLGYRDSTIYKFIIEDKDPEALKELFQAQGIAVTVRNRNIT